jgi:hypothetical protein
MGRAVSHLNSRTTHKGVAECVEVWRNFVFTPVWNTAVFWYAAGSLKFRASLCSQNGSPPPPTPLQKPWFICLTHSNCVVLAMSNVVGDTARLVYHWLCSSMWVEISTQAYESNSCCCPASLSLAYCTHTIQTKVMLKNRRYPQKSMFTIVGGSTTCLL